MSREAMSLDRAWEWVRREFPFDDYIPAARREGYFQMPLAVREWLEPGARILDFGAGPCDKTALISLMGYDVVAFDDWGDDWYTFGDNREKILGFAERAGIDYKMTDEGFEDSGFDAVILNNVIEHLHDSPRRFLNRIIAYLNDGGVIFIDVPNAVNLRKRLAMLRGDTNYPSFESFYWSSYPWRGHVREYVRGDLAKLSEFLGLERLALFSHHYHLETLPQPLRTGFKLVCKLLPGLRESWMLVARKPAGWQPRTKPSKVEASRAFRKHYFKYDREMIDWED